MQSQTQWFYPDSVLLNYIFSPDNLLEIFLNINLENYKIKLYTPIDKPFWPTSFSQIKLYTSSLYWEDLSPCRYFANYKPWIWSASGSLQWIIGYLYWFCLTGHMEVFLGKLRESKKFSWQNSELGINCISWMSKGTSLFIGELVTVNQLLDNSKSNI